MTFFLALAIVQAGTADEARALIEQLSSDSVTVREEASARLFRMGRAAFPHLEEAARGADPEVAGRARDLLAALRWRLPWRTKVGGMAADRVGRLALFRAARARRTLNPYSLFPSKAGKFVVLSVGERLTVFQAPDLKRVKQIEMNVGALVFDKDDGAMTVAGDALVRLKTDSWKEEFRTPLPGAECESPGQAWIGDDGTVYYRTKEEGISRLRLGAGGKPEVKALRLTLRSAIQSARVDRIFDAGLDGWILMEERNQGAVCRKKDERVYSLAVAREVVSGCSFGGVTVIVSRRHSSLYHSINWKHLGFGPEAGEKLMRDRNGDGPPNQFVAFDRTRREIYVFRDHWIRCWSPADPSKERLLKRLDGTVRALAIDGTARQLYALVGNELRCWKLAP